MKKLFSLLALLFITSTALAAATPQKLTVMLDWFANPDHAPLFVAQEQGFFKQQGLSVALIGPANPADPPKLVAAGKADIAITYQPDFLLQINQGLPLVRIATLIDSPLNCLVVNGDSDIKTIADLKGKTIGYSNTGFDTAILSVMLKNAGLSLNDVNLINVNFDLTQGLLAKRVDGVVGMMRNFELLEMQLMGHPGRAFYPEQNGVPSYDQLILVTNKSEAQDPRIAKFLTALAEGVAYLKLHPQQTWQTFAAAHPELDNSLNKDAWFATLKYFPNNPAYLDQERYQNFAIFMQRQGLIDKVPNLASYALVNK